MSTTQAQHQRNLRRTARTRASLTVNTLRPRLTVFRSLRHIFAQIIDDQTGTTLVAASDMKIVSKGTKTVKAEEVGKVIAKLALEKKIKDIRFDRGGYKYHGRVAALAEAARQNGLNF